MALQLAKYMNFHESYLLGIDLSYNWPSSHKGDVLLSKENDTDHFHPNYFGKGKRWHNPKVDRMQKSFNKALDYYKNSDRILTNMTLGGNLKHIPRKKLEDVINV